MLLFNSCKIDFFFFLLTDARGMQFCTASCTLHLLLDYIFSLGIMSLCIPVILHSFLSRL